VARTRREPVPRPVRGQPPYPEQDGKPQHLLGVPARPGSDLVARRVKDRAVPVADSSVQFPTFEPREKPTAGQEERQTIQVRIGRVEVRAAAPSPPTPKPPRPQGFEGYELIRNYVSWERH
jgi:hypothetical protein